MDFHQKMKRKYNYKVIQILRPLVGENHKYYFNRVR